MESILTSIKKYLGMPEEYTAYDPDIIMDINTVFSILTQLGVGPSQGFAISDKTATWENFLPDRDPRLNMVKSYMEKKVRFMFDPPMSSAVSEATKSIIDELQWRLNAQVDPGE